MTKMKLITALTYLLIGLNSNAQSPKIYYENGDVKIYANSQQKTAAWCGGMNTPQFAMADLNHDGKQDIVVYETYIGVKTFINTATSGAPVYTYDPRYEANFPEVIYYLKLADYDRDNIPDLYHYGMSGFCVYKGYYNSSNALSFSFFKCLYYYSTALGWVNAYTQPGDIPDIVDLDRDGDLDYIGYDVPGQFMTMYCNRQVEDGLPPDSIRLCLKTECWGKVLQNYSKTMALGTSCPDVFKNCPKTTHAGNAICVLDYDGDSDFDVFDGNISFSEVQFLKNGKTDYGKSIDTMIAQDTTWGATAGKMVNMPMFPAPFFLDLDQDGSKDLVFTPHSAGYENYKCAAFYKNNGSTANPNFAYQSDTFLIDKMIDLGSASYPMFYDYDRDGKPDLFIGSDGYYQSNGTFKSYLSYYRNTSTASGSPELTEQTRDFLGLGSQNLQGAAPAFGDLNNDGKDDLAIGLNDGTILLYLNTAVSNSMQPVWVAASTPKVMFANGTKTVDVGSYAAPFIYDIDKDGKPDLLCGSQTGHLYFYKNVSTTPGQLDLDSITNKLGAIKISDGGNFYSYSTPFIGKIDNSGKNYMLIGSVSGTIYNYDGFQAGSTAVPYTRIDSGYQGIRAGERAAVTVADVDGDGKYEMVVGNTLGGVKMYRQTSVGISKGDRQSGDRSVKVYPNPAKDVVNIAWEPTFAQSDVRITITSVTGQVLAVYVVPVNQTSLQIKTEELPAGVYYCNVQSGLRRSASPIVIVR
jgi:hypothetical protein